MAINMSDWIQLATTFIGVALGIPVGLWLNKRASEFQHRQEEEQARQRKLAILKALIAEVKHNQDLLNQMEGELKSGQVPLYSLDVDMWGLIGGEVAQVISSGLILTKTSSLYFEFDHMKRKIDALFQLDANPVMSASSLFPQRFQSLADSMLAHLPSAKSLCNEVHQLLSNEINDVETADKVYNSSMDTKWSFRNIAKNRTLLWNFWGYTLTVVATIIAFFAFIFYLINSDMNAVLQVLSNLGLQISFVIFLLAYLGIVVRMVIELSKKMEKRRKITCWTIILVGFILITVFIVFLSDWTFFGLFAGRILGWLFVIGLTVWAMGFPIVRQNHRQSLPSSEREN